MPRGPWAGRGARPAVVLPALVALLASGGALAGCGGGSGPAAAPASSTAPPSTAPASMSASSPPNPTHSPGQVHTDLPDGRHPAYLTRVDAARRTIVVDVVQWFTGEAALKAAAEDGAPEPANDYYVRNANPRLRTLGLVPGAAITVNTLGAAESGSSTKDIPTTLAKLAGNPGLRYALFWVTLHDGRVQRLAEQYLP